MADFGDLGSKTTAIEYQHKMKEMRSRLDQPGTSHCEDCGEKILAARKEKVPWCTRCVPCQEAFEG